MTVTAAGFSGSAIPAVQIGTSQDLAYNAAGGANAQSNAFGIKTSVIEVAAHITGTGVRIAIGLNPDATSGTNKLLPGSGSWYFVVAPGWKLAAVSDDVTSGTLNITEAVGLG